MAVRSALRTRWGPGVGVCVLGLDSGAAQGLSWPKSGQLCEWPLTRILQSHP